MNHKLRVFVSVVMIAAFLFVTGVFIFESDPAVLTGAAGGIEAIFLVWIGFEVAKTGVRTINLPKGEWEPLVMRRYFIGMAALALLYIVALVVDKGQMGGAKAVLVPSILSMVMAFIAAYGTNKITTGAGPE